jgi:choline dehydrogenase-like flavoprotein
MKMDRICIIGSGASGVHFALSVARKGYDVVMLDVGFPKREPIHPVDRFEDLKKGLEDPVAYFLGKDYECAILPDFNSEYYGLPPSKEYVLRPLSYHECRSEGFSPLFSFACGGLAEVWTGGVYPFNEEDLAPFPFRYEDLGPHYEEVAERIGISGVRDDMAQFHPYHRNLLPPLELDTHSRKILDTYERRKEGLNKKIGCYMGRSRVATLSVPKGGRGECSYSGRCLWGCPTEALYTPSATVKECMEFPGFRYVPRVFVTHLRCDANRRIVAAVARSLDTGGVQEFSADRFVLAAGALMSSKIFMDTIHRHTGEIVKLPGLMDNRQILVPFVNLGMVGRDFDSHSYQYHQVVMGFAGQRASDYVHGQITTLKSAMFHPIIQGLPFDLKTSVGVFNGIHAALGVVNVNLSDDRREGSSVTMEVEPGSERTRLVVRYEPPSGEIHRIRSALSRVTRALRALGCIAPPGMVHIRPMGASVHYSGTIPMSSGKGDFTSTADCRSNDFPNLYFADGTTFPSLPSKNLTFSLMANAVRIADIAF